MKTQALLLLYLLPLVSFSQAFTLLNSFSGHGSPVTYLTVHPKDPVVLSGGANGQVLAWNFQTGRLIWEENHHDDQVTDIKFSKDGSLLAIASYDGTVTLWAWPERRLRRSFDNRKTQAYDGMRGNEFSFICFSENDKELFFGGYNKSASRLDIQSEKPKRIIASDEFSVNAGAAAPGSEILALAIGPSIYLISLKNEKQLSMLKISDSYQDFPCELAFVPGEKNTLASWTVDGVICLWDTKSGKLLKKIQAAKTEGSSELAFSGDGRYLLTGNYGNAAKLWDVASWEILQLLEGHQAPVKTFSFSRDGNYILTGSHDRTVKVWTQDQPPPRTSTHSLKQRQIEIQDTIVVSHPEVEIALWDDQKIDGDIISVNVNGEWVIEEFQLSQQPEILQLHLKNKDNFLAIYAHNEGKIPPNTIAVSVSDGNIAERTTLRSDLKTSASMYLVYHPQN
ncbi:MAG: WD40 repeat domain-containing protein [Lewinellaceae bacterium]|nr:WD40 repeat domain-containing protein [Lewinellaceae bacterium]